MKGPSDEEFPYLSVCSGIESATCAWDELGWEPVAFSEIEPFPSAVLKYRFPEIPNLGDMTKYQEWNLERRLALLVGGTPCQSFSVAGLRGGLADPRGALMLTFGNIAARFRPTWIEWENVPGVLNSNDGQDFASFLGLLTGRAVSPPRDGSWPNSGIIAGIPEAYGVAWVVLDAQYFGVPQRRRRVYLVGHLGDWRRAAAVLFESESLQRHSPPSREQGKGVAGTLAARTRGGGGLGTDLELSGGLQVGSEAEEVAEVAEVAETLRGHPRPGSNSIGATVLAFGGNRTSGELEVATALRAKGGTGHGDFESETFAVFDMRGNGDGENVNTLTGDHAGRPTDYDRCVVGGPAGSDITVFDTTQITSKANRSNPKPGDPSHPLSAHAHAPLVAGTLQANGRAAGSATQQDAEAGMLVTHSLRGEGFDASEDGTGRGTPLVPAEYSVLEDEISPPSHERFQFKSQP